MRRRTLLVSGLGAAGALMVGWAAVPPRQRIGTARTLPVTDDAVGLNGWIKITQDGGVLLAMNRSEMGQGVHTALAMLVAEEMDVPLARVRLIQAGPETMYGNVAMFVGSLPLHPRDRQPGAETVTVRASRWMVSKVARELGVNATGGSSSVVEAWDVLRLAAATARSQLVGAASLLWRQPKAELQVDSGVIRDDLGHSAHYGELADMASRTRPGRVQLKPRGQWKLIGQPLPRKDLADKVDGRARFGLDVRQPGQLYAAVRHAPALGGGVGRVDVSPAMALPGVQRVVRLGTVGGSTAALAVVGATTWHAQRGANALRVDWHGPAAGSVDSARIAHDLELRARAALDDDAGHAFTSRGDVAAAARQAVRQFESVYAVPYLAHATMEPMNATAQVHADGRVDVWAPTQVPGLARSLAARVAGVPESQVTVHVTYLGGGFGRRLEVDVIGQAVRVALECGGKPVQLAWSREEDMTHDFYRPAAAAALRASLDAQGRPIAWRLVSAGDAITPRWIERSLPALAGPFDMPDKTAAEGLFDLPYAVANQRISHVATLHRVPVGYWRSVGHSHNAFFSESFIDELAHHAGQDPVDYRLGLLVDMPRHARVLRLAAERANWGAPLPTGQARGVALHESFGSIVAQVVEVARVDGRLRVQRVVCAADIGTVINPDIVAQQMESGILFGLTAALHGRIDIAASRVQQRNFPDYRLLTLAETPLIETHLVPSSLPPGGVGEPGTPPVAPALANALFALTGRRQRSLPLVV